MGAFSPARPPAWDLLAGPARGEGRNPGRAPAPEVRGTPPAWKRWPHPRRQRHVVRSSAVPHPPPVPQAGMPAGPQTRPQPRRPPGPGASPTGIVEASRGPCGARSAGADPGIPGLGVAALPPKAGVRDPVGSPAPLILRSEGADSGTRQGWAGFRSVFDPAAAGWRGTAPRPGPPGWPGKPRR